MNIVERRVPQEGSVIREINGVDVDMKISSIPLITDEKIVIRILDKNNCKKEQEFIKSYKQTES